MAPHLHRVVLAALFLPLAGCLLIISTSPTPLRQANVIVIVRTNRSGEPVAGAGVRIQSSGSSAVIGRGATDVDGRFVSAVARNEDELRIVVDVPTGFTSPTIKSGSVEVVLPSGSDQVTVWLERKR